MAEQHYERGHMEIGEQEKTFRLFVGMAKWGSLAVANVLLFFTLWICTGAGFWGALIATAVLDVVGVTLLRQKPEAAAAH
jgi:hypothetical protein